MVVNINDGMDRFQRTGSSQSGASALAQIHLGIVTNVDIATRSASVRVPSVNPTAELGPYKVMQHFENPVTTEVKQTVTTTSAPVPGVGTFLTGATLSSTTTPLSGTYASLTLPAVGSRVLVVFLDNSLDEGVIVGYL